MVGGDQYLFYAITRGFLRDYWLAPMPIGAMELTRRKKIPCSDGIVMDKKERAGGAVAAYSLTYPLKNLNNAFTCSNMPKLHSIGVNCRPSTHPHFIG